ncbi:MAG: helix-turn-helix transcriptional regulator [Proteobacteria bacterium]|nr:helix-turn-helix transcriptional regulator [Pseudomonadota bacterium]
MDISGYVGAAVRVLRLRDGISQEELADRASLDRTYISGIERNRRNPSVQSLQRIVGAMGASLDLLFNEARRLADADRPAKAQSRRK